MIYNIYSDYLKEKYGEKVYKLPVNLPITCPNRDGTCGSGGCIFCGEKGTGYESLSNQIDVKDQLERNAEYIGKKYGAKKFIAYFQNFSNTYMPPNLFKEYISQAYAEKIVGIDVSTRPDCISEKYLEILAETGKDITVELGLQTANYNTLHRLNRGHGLAEYISAVLKIKTFGFKVCTHVIIDIPYDGTDDVAETAKIISVLKSDFVKMHSLYVVKDTVLEKLYSSGDIKLLTAQDYVERCVLFLRYLRPETVVQRLIGRAPEEDTVTANFGISWWKIKDMILEYMQSNGYVQGDLYRDVSAAAVEKFTGEQNDKN